VSNITANYRIPLPAGCALFYGDIINSDYAA